MVTNYIFNFHYCKEILHSIAKPSLEALILNIYLIDGLGWSGGAMVLGKLPVLGRPTYLDESRARPTVLAVGAGWGCLDIFCSHLSFLFSFSLSLGETARYRLKYCLKGPLSPKTTNQPMIDGHQYAQTWVNSWRISFREIHDGK